MMGISTASSGSRDGNGSNTDMPNDIAEQKALNESLLTACRTGRMRTALDLLDRGADIGARTILRSVEDPANGRTPLHLAAACTLPEDDIDALIVALLSRGAEVDARDKVGNTALHLVVRHGSVKALEALMAHGANPNARGPFERLPLHLAVGLKHAHMAVALIQGGADPNARTPHGQTALHGAVRLKEHGFMTEKLLQNGADCNARDREGATPLHLAAAELTRESTSSVNALLRMGADVNATDARGLTPLEGLLQRITTPCGSPLEQGFRQLPIYGLVAYGADTTRLDPKEHPDLHGVTALYAAVALEDVARVNVLLEAGANLNETRNGLTMLQMTEHPQLRALLQAWEARRAVEGLLDVSHVKTIQSTPLGAAP